MVVVDIVVLVIHVDWGVGLFVVGRHGESGLVWINVLAAADLFIARQIAVLLVIVQRECTDEGRENPAESASIVSQLQGSRQVVYSKGCSYVSKNAMPTTALLTAQAVPHVLAVL